MWINCRQFLSVSSTGLWFRKWKSQRRFRYQHRVHRLYITNALHIIIIADDPTGSISWRLILCRSSPISNRKIWKGGGLSFFPSSQSLLALCKMWGGSGLFIATITKQVLNVLKIDIDAMLISYLWNIHVQCMFHWYSYICLLKQYFKKLLCYTMY